MASTPGDPLTETRRTFICSAAGGGGRRVNDARGRGFLPQLLDRSIRLATLEILGQRDVHPLEDRAPEVAEPDILLDDVALMLDPQACASIVGKW